MATETTQTARNLSRAHAHSLRLFLLLWLRSAPPLHPPRTPPSSFFFFCVVAFVSPPNPSSACYQSTCRPCCVLFLWDPRTLF
ncbi:hypothetical protein TRSC58_07253 [Trypanosoma rangeli SC58]|uniref:Uncharacterized protein n=1 Tax=Trypanosoma rangeli SC58 TaxID=429131 RepID=A0A061IT77_TRYRA|nr:hypothetical protein TRSC58_07253 [Trypanosoma rangeli SC58]